MDIQLIERARARVPSVPVLVNMVSQRVQQLNRGERPYVKPLSMDEDRADIALREIAEGLLIAEVDIKALQRLQDVQEQWED